MSDTQSDLVQVLQRAVDRAKPAGTELAFHTIVSNEGDGVPFTTIHVVTHDGQPVDRQFNFAAVARTLGDQTRARVEDRKVFGQREPVPYKVITGTAGDWPFEIVFLQNAPG